MAATLDSQLGPARVYRVSPDLTQRVAGESITHNPHHLILDSVLCVPVVVRERTKL